MATPRGGGRGQHPFRFRAKYAGRCGCCGTEFGVGDEVEYGLDNVLVIVECEGGGQVPTEQEQAEARAKRCPSCFLVHAPAQKECA